MLKPSFIIFLLLHAVCNGHLPAQNLSIEEIDPETIDDGPGLVRIRNFYFGITAGSLFANKHTTRRYDGSDIEYDNVYDFSFQTYINQQVIYKQIFNDLGQRDFSIGEYPENMRYKPSVTLGLSTGYYFSEATAAFIEVNVSRLKIIDALTLNVVDAGSTLSEPIIEIAAITGKEDRMDIIGGLHSDFTYGERLMFYGEVGGILNSTRARYNDVVVKGRTYVLTSYNKNNSSAYPGADWGGLGYGFMFGLGVRYKFNKEASFDLGASMYLQKINLGPEALQKLKPQFLFYIRGLWL